MTKETTCRFDRREETLVAFVYGEIDPADRERFENHVRDCPACRLEVEALTGLRADLADWAPPEPAAGVGGRPERTPWPVPGTRPAGGGTTPWVPAWLQAVAAVLIAGVALGAANLRVSYTPESGLLVRTGWLHDAVEDAASPPASVEREPSGPGPWQEDLASLEASLRAAIRAEVVSRDGAGDALDDEALLRRVRALIVESERRQQRELALRVAEVARDAQIQRQADLVKIERSLGLIQSRTGVEVMRTQQQLNSLAQRVSQRP